MWGEGGGGGGVVVWYWVMLKCVVMCCSILYQCSSMFANKKKNQKKIRLCVFVILQCVTLYIIVRYCSVVNTGNRCDTFMRIANAR